MPLESGSDPSAAIFGDAEFRSILDAAEAMIVATDQDGVVRMFNPAAHRMLGWSADEVIGIQSPVTWIAPAELEAWVADLSYARDRHLTPETSILEAMARMGAGHLRPLTMIRRDGTSFVASLAVSKMRNARGQFDGFVITGLTPVNQNGSDAGAAPPESFLEQLQAEKMRTVAQLAGGIAHDFNNFLLLVSHCSEQLLARIPAGDSNRSTVAAISDAGVRAARLTRQLLAFSRRQKLNMAIVDLNQLLIHSDQVIRRLIRRNVIVALNLCDQPALVYIDVNQLDDILLNLALNAQDAMPDGGRLSIETRYEEAPPAEIVLERPSPTRRCVVLSVADTGCGMTEEVQAKIFEPYFTTKDVSKGTGLGLAVVHGVVMQFGGHIRVMSAVGVGTTIEIRLPTADSDSQMPTSDSDASLPVTADTILLVEDETDVRNLLKISLEAEGYAVLEARHGPDAIAAAIRHAKPIHLLLTDVELPEMSGYAVAEALRADHPSLPALFMSGHLIGDDASQASTAIDSYLSKPFKTSELLKKVRRMLSWSRR